MRAWMPLLILSLAPAAQAGMITLTTPLFLQVTDGIHPASTTGTASDVSITTPFNDATSGWQGNATLALPGSYSGGAIQMSSPLSFGLTNVFFACVGHSPSCTDELDVNFSFAMQIVSGFDELASAPMSATISYSGTPSGVVPQNASFGSLTMQGTFTNSLSAVSNFFRSFALAGNVSFGSTFTNAAGGSFGPSGHLGTLAVNGSLRLSGPVTNGGNVQLPDLNFAFDAPAAVPEPGTLALLILGTGMCLWLIRRRAIPAIALRRSSLRPAVPANLAAAPVLPGTRAGNGAVPEAPRS